jgi:hypothetical protein
MEFEDFFERNFLPADACCIAGDIANDYFNYVEFLKFIAEKYKAVYVCLGTTISSPNALGNSAPIGIFSPPRAR